MNFCARRCRNIQTEVRSARLAIEHPLRAIYTANTAFGRPDEPMGIIRLLVAMLARCGDHTGIFPDPGGCRRVGRDSSRWQAVNTFNGVVPCLYGHAFTEYFTFGWRNLKFTGTTFRPDRSRVQNVRLQKWRSRYRPGRLHCRVQPCRILTRLEWPYRSVQLPQWCQQNISDIKPIGSAWLKD